MTQAAPAVRAEGLVKTFDGGDDAVEAVRGVDLEIQTGEIFGFALKTRSAAATNSGGLIFFRCSS